jgi:hypothetical protein
VLDIFEVLHLSQQGKYYIQKNMRLAWFVNLCFTYLFFIIMLGRGTLWHLQKFLQYIKHIIFQLTPSIILLYPSTLHFWNSFNKYHFSIYIHVYTIFAPYSPSHALLPHPPHSHWYQSPRKGMFSPPVLWLCIRVKEEGKNEIFVCLTQKCLWHFHIYTYYTPIWIISSIFLLSTLVLFLW